MRDATPAPAGPDAPATPPLPRGFAIALDAQTCRPAPDRLFGGSPQRGLRLSEAGRTALQDLLAGPVRTRSAGVLARRLTDAGLAHPCPPEQTERAEVTVLVPAYERAESLERALAALGREYPVIVIDDGSADPDTIAAVARTHGASLLRREVNGGPGAARATGLAQVSSEFVAFVDSDCLPGPGWIDALAAHFADPLVAAVAPRIAAVPAHSPAGRYAAARSSLDMGTRPARVAAGSRVPYAPTAALLVRTAALRAVGEPAFDAALRVGEDVDLIWRLTGAGWRIRYEPAVEVGHCEPQTWAGLLRRRYSYGTSAGPLALRHPQAMAPFVLNTWAFTAVAGMLARRPLVAAAGATGLVARSGRTLRRAGLPPAEIARRLAEGIGQTWLGAGRYARQFASPALVACLLAPAGRRRGRRAAVAALALAGPVTEWITRRPRLDPLRYVAASIADDIAYGGGVWAGSVRARTAVAIRPTLARGLQRPRWSTTKHRPHRGGQQ